MDADNLANHDDKWSVQTVDGLERGDLVRSSLLQKRENCVNDDPSQTDTTSRDEKNNFKLIVVILQAKELERSDLHARPHDGAIGAKLRQNIEVYKILGLLVVKRPLEDQGPCSFIDHVPLFRRLI